MAIITHYLQSALNSVTAALTATILMDTGFLLCITFAALMIFRTVGQTLKLPPGPTGFPIVGIIPLIKKEFHLMLFDYSKIFGKILSFKMGRETIVVLSDYKTIKKAFQTRDFIVRPKSELSSLLGGYGEFKTH
jgi:Cytochrome P450